LPANIGEQHDTYYCTECFRKNPLLKCTYKKSPSTTGVPKTPKTPKTPKNPKTPKTPKDSKKFKNSKNSQDYQFNRCQAESTQEIHVCPGASFRST